MLDHDGQMLMLDSATEKRLLRHHDQDLDKDSGGKEEEEEVINVT